MKVVFPVLVVTSSVAGHGIATEVANVQNGTTMNMLGIHCTPRTKDGVWSWYFNSRSDGPYTCKTEYNTGEWSMLNAYRSGGAEGVHWKYTDNSNDPACLKDWKYYSSDGQSVITTVSGRTTTHGDSRRWCGLPVYRSGGVEDKQWAVCWCQWD